MIPNVDKTNNKFVWGNNDIYKSEIPVGSYELKYLIEIITTTVSQEDDEAVITITPNIHTAKDTISSNRIINFEIENSIGSVLRFKKKILAAENIHHSDEEVRISKVNAICVDCNSIWFFFEFKTGSHYSSVLSFRPVRV